MNFDFEPHSHDPFLGRCLLPDPPDRITNAPAITLFTHHVRWSEVDGGTFTRCEAWLADHGIEVASDVGFVTPAEIDGPLERLRGKRRPNSDHAAIRRRLVIHGDRSGLTTMDYAMADELCFSLLHHRGGSVGVAPLRLPAELADASELPGWIDRWRHLCPNATRSVVVPPSRVDELEPVLAQCDLDFRILDASDRYWTGQRIVNVLERDGNSSDPAPGGPVAWRLYAPQFDVRELTLLIAHGFTGVAVDGLLPDAIEHLVTQPMVASRVAEQISELRFKVQLAQAAIADGGGSIRTIDPGDHVE